MFDKIVLGFLMKKRMTGYEIKATMGRSTNFFYNTSFGNIYPTLKKLEQSGLVLCDEEVKNGKLNKSYSITTSGRKIFLQWLSMHSEIAMIRDEALCRVFFFSHLEKKQIEDELNAYILRLSDQIDILKRLKKNITFENDQWRLKTLDFGIDYYTNLKKSYQKMLSEVNEE
ncbi:MAG TPA: PadR family transcriptional regulator [Spirochaetota bacterium]|nr:PadR family transcriptional regulator [Spirochaetota bacterium]HPI91311.1 PadR family transcriptional regulator [Spirochaetota bacterium]HPR49190.1 PadR family transcriptional regulator [Spirochaetota bacterium]